MANAFNAANRMVLYEHESTYVSVSVENISVDPPLMEERCHVDVVDKNGRVLLSYLHGFVDDDGFTYRVRLHADYHAAQSPYSIHFHLEDSAGFIFEEQILLEVQVNCRSMIVPKKVKSRIRLVRFGRENGRSQ